VQDAIDQLERVVGGSYRPGDGLVGERDGIACAAALGDHVRAASALLTAFELTGRLPVFDAGRRADRVRAARAVARRRLVIRASARACCAASRRCTTIPAIAARRSLPAAPTIAREAARILGGRVGARARRRGRRRPPAYGLALLDLLK
jgi:hypothetical protein